jgi:hypothetical protein
MEMSERIKGCETPFELRYLLSSHPAELRTDHHIRYFKAKLLKFMGLYHYKGDAFLSQVVENLTEDFEAEIEGVHQGPPPIPRRTKYEPNGEYVTEWVIEFPTDIKLDIPEGENNILKQLEILAIQHALRATGWNRTKASAKLGVGMRTLRNKLNDLTNRGLMVRGVDTYERESSEGGDDFGLDDYYRKQHQVRKRQKPSQVRETKRNEKEKLVCPVVEAEKARQEKTEKQTISPITEKRKPARSEMLPNPIFPSMATCHPNKLEWMGGKCLTCHKANKTKKKQ